LPIALSEGCTLVRDVAKDDVIRMTDVEQAPDGNAASLWREQFARWPITPGKHRESLQAAATF